jgi:2'-5' RNA ligase
MKKVLFLILTLFLFSWLTLPAQEQVKAIDKTALVRSPESTPAEKVLKRGPLFSAISFADSTFGAEWSRLRAKAQAKFPNLKLKKTEDLHITVVFIGKDWKMDELDRIRAHALVAPTSSMLLTPEVVRMGPRNDIVAVELHGVPQAWKGAVIDAKNKLNLLGLKKAEEFDMYFRPHISLAKAQHNPITEIEAAELSEFMSWLTLKIAEAQEKFIVTVGPQTRVELLLNGGGKDPESSEYITVENFLQAQQALAPVK